MEKIKFEKCPLCPDQFDILDLESEKKEISPTKARLHSAPFLFLPSITSTREVVEGHWDWAMTKKKGNSKAVGKKSAKKRTAAKKKKELSAAEVREDITHRIRVRAAILAEKVMDEGEKGQLAPLKYFFEMAKIFPETNDGSEVSKDEESLAKTLLDRLNIPHEPAKQLDDEDEEETIVIPARMEEATAGDGSALAVDAESEIVSAEGATAGEDQ